MSNQTWKRVSRSASCLICRKPDWCLICADGTAAICARIESGKRYGDAGWLHVLMDAQSPAELRTFRIPFRISPSDMTPLALRFQRAAGIERLQMFARSLSVSPQSLIDFGTGWSSDHLAWSFPMTDPTSGKVIGIRLRRPDGAKFAVKGGRDGLFLVHTRPTESVPDPNPLLIVEGATDAIAAHGLGFLNVVGRPSCTGGTRFLIAMVQTLKPLTVAIVADNDEAGIRGAEALARTLAVYTPDVRVIVPPIQKDLRRWVLAGAIRADLDQLIRTTATRRLSIRTTFRGQK